MSQRDWDPTHPYVPGQGWAQPTAAGLPSTPPPVVQPPRDRRPLLIVMGLAGVMAVALLAWLIVRPSGSPLAPTAPTTAGQPSGKFCPKPVVPSGSPSVRPDDGRVRGGQLSFPRLGPPWSNPRPLWRTPYTVDEWWQFAGTEFDASGKATWVSSVHAAELTAGDGLPQPAQAQELVLDCIMGTYQTAVERTYVASRAMQVSGRDAWFTEVHLTFDKPGIKAKGERVLLVVVRTAPESTSMFLASIPDGNPSHLADARTAMAGLRVG